MVRIGEVGPWGKDGSVKANVLASVGGVEIMSDSPLTLDPVQARNYAALLVRGAQECERMRRQAERQVRRKLARGERVP